MPTFSANISVSTPSGTVAGRISDEAEEFIQQDFALAASSTPLAPELSVGITKLKMFFLKSDVDTTVTVKNASDTVGTILLNAGEPFFWAATGQNPAVTIGDLFSDDITSLSIVNGEPTKTGMLNVRALVDPT